MMRGWIVVAILALSSAPALANDAYRTCLESHSTNVDWLDCGKAYIAHEEAAMAETLDKLMSLFDQKTVDEIRAEQEAWLKFKELSCKMYADQERFGREDLVLSHPSCIAKRIAGRCEQLKDYLRQIYP